MSSPPHAPVSCHARRRRAIGALLAACFTVLCMTAAEAREWSSRGGTYPDAGYLGLAAWNGLAGVQVEVANPVGSVFIMAGGHADTGSVDDWEKGNRFGFMAGLRFLAGDGLSSGWHGTLFGGTLAVETQREDGRRVAYQRLGGGGGLGYQLVRERLRAGFTLGVAQLETIRTQDGGRVGSEFIPVLEASAGFRF